MTLVTWYNHKHRIIHILMSYHSQFFLCIHDTYFMHMHAIGAAEEITLVELKADPQEED